MNRIEDQGLGGVGCGEHYGEQGLQSLQLTQKVKTIAISQMFTHHNGTALSRTHKFHGLACR